MTRLPWTRAHTERAKRIWQEYQRTHDLSDRMGQVVGIDPDTEQV